MSKRLGLTLIAVAGLAACGGGGGGSSHDGFIACSFAVDSECDEVSGPQAALDVMGFTPSGCTASGGVQVAACTAASRVGRCTLHLTSGATTVTLVGSLYAPGYDAVTAASSCSVSGGTFGARVAAGGAGWRSAPAEAAASFEAE
ncbi:MAG TPA: hypothetical protein VFP50_07655 [Anaeromyxobacteraceae bacterium]|nr:hypothetical protein [Anaeromyxobacteraceae bacterium]